MKRESRLVGGAALVSLGALALSATLIGGTRGAAQIVPPHPRPPVIRPLAQVALADLEIRAEVREGVASVNLTHTFANRSGAPQEGDFVFPIPAGAAVREFALYDGEKRLDAQLLNKEQATAAYEEIVRQRRDPALLTYTGRSALRVRLFPIAPGSQRKVTMRLVSVLPRENNSWKWSWTLAGPHLARPEHVSVHATFFGAGNVYSPTHALDLRRDPDGKTVARYSADSKDATLNENGELTVYAAPQDPRAIALSALTYNVPAQFASLGGGPASSGYFLVVASPNLPDAARTAPPRRVVLVMDRSGSMAGKKMEQARGALKVALNRLRPQDYFNVLTFSDKVEKFSDTTISATKENLKRANAFVDDIVTDSGTNINDGLQAGLAQFPERGRGNTLLFFTDGLPTVGERSQSAIVQNAVKAAGDRARVFVFGVGYDVDVPFLDTVAQKLRGDADYVRPDEDIEVKTGQFVAKTSTPVLENLKLTITGGASGEVYPKPDQLPDLFDGGQLVLVGRYTNASDRVQIALTGEAAGKPQRFEINTSFPADSRGADFLPRLWASRKIGYLMDEIRLAEGNDPRKQEIITQIVALSQEFGVLTPYTALFVPEPVNGAASGPIVRFNSALGGPGGMSAGGAGFGGGRAAGAVDTVSKRLALRAGEAAVNNSQAGRAQRGQGQVGNSYALNAQAGQDRAYAEEQVRRIQNVAARTFYQNGAVWEDARYDPKKQTDVVKVKLFSDAYFALTRRNADLARWAAVGSRVRIAVNAKQAVEFGDEGKEKLTEAEINALLK